MSILLELSVEIEYSIFFSHIMSIYMRSPFIWFHFTDILQNFGIGILFHSIITDVDFEWFMILCWNHHMFHLILIIIFIGNILFIATSHFCMEDVYLPEYSSMILCITYSHLVKEENILNSNSLINVRVEHSLSRFAYLAHDFASVY